MSAIDRMLQQFWAFAADADQASGLFGGGKGARAQSGKRWAALLADETGFKLVAPSGEEAALHSDLSLEDAMDRLSDVKLGGAKLVLRIKPGLGVWRSLVLPAAAARQSHEAVRFSAARLSPIPLEEARYAIDPRTETLDDGQIRVRIAFVARALLDKLIEGADRLGLKPAAIDLSIDGADACDPPAFDLRGGEAPKRRISVFAAALLAGLLLLVVGNFAEGLSASLRDETLKLQEKAAARGLPGPAQDLVEDKMGQASAIAALNAAAIALPDSAYLERFVLTKDEARFFGKTTDAKALAPAIEAHPAFQNAVLVGPASAPGAPGAFELRARIENPEALTQ